ncbi:MAG: ABC transporter permease [Chloroflexales bacterium]|nr:ABC transporter permease [Chloroflexales bacterium]
MSTVTEQTTQSPPVQAARSRSRSRKLRRYFTPQENIPRRVYLGAMVATVVLIILAWCVLTYGGVVNSLFLPAPDQVARTLAVMVQDGTLWTHASASLMIILIGWLTAAVVAVPLGILMGSFRLFEAALEPMITFVRYLPVSALIPLLILYVGIGDETRITVIFIGTFFQLIVLVADVAAHVAHDLLDSAYTLGASRRRVVTHVLIPATLPGVMDNLRITIGWAWTYLVVAELVAAERGLGYLILDSMRGLFVDRIFVGLLTIGLLGFASDQLFKWLHHKLLPWSPKIG